MDSALVKKGKDCVALVNTTLAEIQAGRVDGASSQLDTLKKDGSELAAQAEALATRLEKVEEYYRQQGEELQRKIGEYGRREEDLQKQKSNVESTLASEQSVLASNESQLSQARSALDSAQRKRREKEEVEKKLRTGAMIGGAVLGAFTFGIGALAGAAAGVAAGAGLAALINELKEDEKRAAREVERRETDRRNAESSVAATKQSISSIQADISRLFAEIAQMKEQRNKYNDEAGELKEAIAFLRESVQFWQLFKQASQHGANRTEIYQRIVDKARQKTNLQVLHKSPTKRIAATFLEAWESMETMAEEGGNRHVIQLEFRCSQCNGNRTELPFVKDESFLCAECHSRLAIT